MPPMQVMAEAAGGIFGASQISKLDPEIFASDVRLADAIESLGIARTRYQKEFLDSWPLSQQEAIRATLYSAVTRGVPVTFAWAPGYDYEVTIWEAASTPESRSWITILMKSRYPEDQLPEGVRRSKSPLKAAKSAAPKSKKAARKRKKVPAPRARKRK